MSNTSPLKDLLSDEQRNELRKRQDKAMSYASDGDEYLCNSLIGLIRSELQLARKNGTEIDRAELFTNITKYFVK